MENVDNRQQTSPRVIRIYSGNNIIMHNTSPSSIILIIRARVICTLLYAYYSGW